MGRLQIPVILVPGFLDSKGRMHNFARHLQKAGLQALEASPQPSDGTIGIEVMAWQLAKFIETEFPCSQPLALVGFSMGGLICRSYVQQLGGHLRTQQLITLSTPHYGTYSSYLFNRPANQQMRPGSLFLHELNNNLQILQQIAFTSIWTPFDLTILPAESSRLPVGEMLQIPTLIHRYVVNDRRVWQAVQQRLTTQQTLKKGRQSLACPH